MIRFLWLFFQRSKVAHAVLEYKEFVIESGIRTIDEEKMQYFLDRFYMSRIAIRVLINQHGNFLSLRKNKTMLIEKIYLCLLDKIFLQIF